MALVSYLYIVQQSTQFTLILGGRLCSNVVVYFGISHPENKSVTTAMSIVDVASWGGWGELVAPSQ